MACLNIRFRFHNVFPFVIQTDALINSLQTAKSKYIMYIIYVSASIQIWVSTCNKKPFLKILRASTTLEILVDATAPRLTNFTLIY